MFIEQHMAPKMPPQQPIDAADAELEVTLTQVQPGEGPMAVNVRTLKVRYPLQSGLPAAPDGGALLIGRLRLHHRSAGVVYTVDLRAAAELEPGQ